MATFGVGNQEARDAAEASTFLSQLTLQLKVDSSDNLAAIVGGRSCCALTKVVRRGQGDGLSWTAGLRLDFGELPQHLFEEASVGERSWPSGSSVCCVICSVHCE